jgi:phenylacetate-coenzyme A ligase PaaK-like adenylate-forming protein
MPETKPSEIIDRCARELESWQRLSVDEVRARQDARLAAIVRFHFLSDRNDAYRKLLRSVGIEHEEDLPRSVAELSRLPKVTRSFLEQANYAERPCVPPEALRKVVETSGSSGTPLRLPHTLESAERCYGVSLLRAALLGGMNPDANSYFVGHWVPGGKDVWTSHEAMQAFEDLVGERAFIESTHAKMPEHLAHLDRHAPAWAASTPTFFLALAAYALEVGIDLRKKSLRHLLLGGGTCPPENRSVLREAYGLEGLGLIYATSESFLSAAELADEPGYLCFEDEYVIEVVDEADKPVSPGSRGRILITCLGNRGYPGIRYAQGDAVTLLGPSSRFPGFVRIDRPERIDGGEIGEARLLYSEIESMQRQLFALGVLTSAFQIARRREHGKDVPVIRLETREGDHAKVEALAREVFARHPVMNDMLMGGMIATPTVELYMPGALTLGRAKVPFYVDERPK